MKPLIIYAIVDKKKPKLSYNSLIRKEDIKDIKIYKDEKLIKVSVSEIK